jgi:hypothetical protein
MGVRAQRQGSCDCDWIGSTGCQRSRFVKVWESRPHYPYTEEARVVSAGPASNGPLLDLLSSKMITGCGYESALMAVVMLESDRRLVVRGALSRLAEWALRLHWHTDGFSPDLTFYVLTWALE